MMIIAAANTADAIVSRGGHVTSTVRHNHYFLGLGMLDTNVTHILDFLTVSPS